MGTDIYFLPRKYTKDDCMSEYGLFESLTFQSDGEAYYGSNNLSAVTICASAKLGLPEEVTLIDKTLAGCPAGKLFVVGDVVTKWDSPSASTSTYVRLKLNTVQEHYDDSWVNPGVGFLKFHTFVIEKDVSAGDMNAVLSVNNIDSDVYIVSAVMYLISVAGT